MKIPLGRYADTTQLGASTTSLILKSTATLHSARARLGSRRPYAIAFQDGKVVQQKPLLLGFSPGRYPRPSAYAVQNLLEPARVGQQHFLGARVNDALGLQCL